MKLYSLLLLAIVCSCFAGEQQAASRSPAADANQPDKQKPLVSATRQGGACRSLEARAGAGKEQPIAQTPLAPPNVVAKIGDYAITREELKLRLMMELRPYEDEQYNLIVAPPDAKTVLTKMLAEKAMMMEGRRQNFLEDPIIRDVVRQFKDRNLTNLLLQKQLQSKLVITDAEIEEKTRTDPKLDGAQAKANLERTKANKLLEQYYSDIYEKFHVQKLKDNFAKAAQIHQRLLNSPKMPRNAGFIRISQIDSDLTPEEKDMVLAMYDYGKLTLKDWFNALCEMAPPRRPTDLNTPEGVERLLDVALKIPLFVSEAKLLGLDKDENFVKRVKEWEDIHLLDKVRTEKFKDINEPTNEQIIDHFNKNKAVFITDRALKIDQIWCQDLKTAQKAKAELDAGKNFESVRELYSLEKTGKPFDTYIGSEGMFFQDLWKGEPNQIAGPLKGFYNESIRWRIVKILEKNPGKPAEYSGDMKDRVKWKIIGEQRNSLLEKYGKELLEKYPHEIYADKISDIDPLNIP